MLPILAVLALSSVQDPAPPQPVPDVHAEHPARALFLAHCAQCHGETGDGKGTTKLDRDARSFQLGGFSYGNTPEAVARTVTYGIPGTPMPSFESALKPEERRSLAEYVLLLGPPQEKVDPKESVIAVGDRPVIVRGKLPPLVGGANETVRGLLIGTPEGLTFEYRVDDVRLLGVLKGDFVDRADWRGRGGDALVPLGKPVYVRPDVEDAWLFARFGAVARRRLRASEVAGSAGRLHYDLLASDGARVASVVETPSAFSCSVGAGYSRLFEITFADGRTGEPAAFLGTTSFDQHPNPATAEFVLRRPVGAAAKGVLACREFVLPVVLWPADPAEQRRIQSAFLEATKP